MELIQKKKPLFATLMEQQANIDQLVSEKLKAESARKEITDLKTAKIENEQLKRKLRDQEQDLILKFEPQLSEKLQQEAENIQKRESERVELKLKERDEFLKNYSNYSLFTGAIESFYR